MDSSNKASVTLVLITGRDDSSHFIVTPLEAKPGAHRLAQQGLSTSTNDRAWIVQKLPKYITDNVQE